MVLPGLYKKMFLHTQCLICYLQVRLDPAVLADKKWVKIQVSVNIPKLPRGLRIINKQLWCCHQNGITAFNENLDMVRTIPGGEMGECHDVAQDNDDDILIAAANGVYLLAAAGTGKPLPRFTRLSAINTV